MNKYLFSLTEHELVRHKAVKWDIWINSLNSVILQLNDTWEILCDQQRMKYLWRKNNYPVMNWDAKQSVEWNFSFVICKKSWKKFVLLYIKVYLFCRGHPQEQMIHRFSGLYSIQEKV